MPTLAEVRAAMSDQWRQCQNILNTLNDGKGALCHITMTVNKLGKIDLYQWLYFAALHARRHVRQMGAIEAEYTAHASADSVVNRKVME